MVERAAVNGVIVVRFHAGEPLPGSPSGGGLLSYKQKQWSSILHPGTKEKRVDNPLQDVILPHYRSAELNAPVAEWIQAPVF